MSRKPVITRELAPLPVRREDAHKGDMGRLVIIGGCDGDITMAGAPALAAKAAFRSGVGLVRVVVPQALKPTVTTLVPMVTTAALTRHAGAAELAERVSEFDADVVALGPGLGDTLQPDTVAEFASSCARFLVIDADGLNLLARAASVPPQHAERIVLTPHPGEARRLLEARGLPADLEDRQAAALALHESFGAVIVLKGRGTVVTNGLRLYVNETGNAGMATAGTGDVLTGVIAALLGQGMEPFEAAVLGVHVHGLAGDFAAQDLGQIAMTAEDLIAYLPDAFAEFEE